jgi:hypothetical protein
MHMQVGTAAHVWRCTEVEQLCGRAGYGRLARHWGQFASSAPSCGSTVMCPSSIAPRLRLAAVGRAGLDESRPSHLFCSSLCTRRRAREERKLKETDGTAKRKETSLDSAEQKDDAEWLQTQLWLWLSSHTLCIPSCMLRRASCQPASSLELAPSTRAPLMYACVRAPLAGERALPLHHPRHAEIIRSLHDACTDRDASWLLPLAARPDAEVRHACDVVSDAEMSASRHRQSPTTNHQPSTLLGC